MRVPPGACGELYLAGAGLARCYLNQPQLTAERFMPNPYGGAGERMYRTGDLARYRPDGTLEYLGRRDRQVKVRGYRIEPAEVEEALRTAGAREAVVVPQTDRLAGYVEIGSTPLADIRKAAAEILPRYLMPAEWICVGQWNRTPSGKIDRAHLPAPESYPATGSTPRGGVEEMLAGIYRSILGTAEIDRDTSFFDMGGHSLLALQLAGRLRSELGVEIPIREIFENPTVGELALRLEGRMPHSPPTGLITAPTARFSGPLTAAQRRLWFMEQLAGRGSQYNVPIVLSIEGQPDAGAVIVVHYEL